MAHDLSAGDSRDDPSITHLTPAPLLMGTFPQAEEFANERPRRRHGEGHYGRPSVFDAAADESMVVLLDESASSTPDPVATFLAGLALVSPAQLLRYSDDGPPVDQLSDYGEGFGEGAPGWVTLEINESDPMKWLGRATVVQGGSVASHGMLSADALNAFVGFRSQRGGPVPDYRASERGRAGLAALCADAIGADVLVTRRPDLLNPPFKLARRVFVSTARDALPLVGLYLRTNGQYVVDASPDGRVTGRLDRGLFWWVAARTLLPSGWRWMSACVSHSVATQDETLQWLTTSLHQRVATALKLRDDVHSALLVPQDNNTADDAITALEFIALTLMSAFDVAARVAHHAIGLSSNVRGAGWHLDSWRRRVARTHPELVRWADQSDSADAAVYLILRTLRNAIHGESLSPLAVVSHRALPARRATMVGMPRRDAEAFSRALELTGGSASWGVEPVVPGRLHADPGLLVERLVPSCLALLDAILRLTPVEELAQKDPAGVIQEPPAGDTPFHPDIRDRVMWQLGLTPEMPEGGRRGAGESPA